ncbi:MAG: hypothetical protein QOJ35_2304 [Solirubrobacteraceae bacterium]|jgi:hypothetical protein|nr:hypothetical protein [Solirubrobacteraceae bacterium]
MMGMQDVLVPLVIAVAAVGVVVAILTLTGRAPWWREIGRGGFGFGRDDDDRPSGGAASGERSGEREQEIRQLLGARNARRERRGEAVVDVDAELAALTHTVPEAGLLDEVRAVVEAHNHRRVRDGLEPLDVDAEIERRLRELT